MVSQAVPCGGPQPVSWWVLQLPQPRSAAANAPRFEADGWDGIAYGDNQCKVGDVVVTLALAAQATERVMLNTGCTNAVTRHPTVLAATWAAPQELWNGRMVLGVGRGDSAHRAFAVGNWRRGSRSTA
jgi:5,10-methylenetetrahydromethanopterin reductase